MSEANAAKSAVIDSAEGTVARSREILRPLTESEANRQVSMTAPQREELCRFVQAHACRLESSIGKARAKDQQVWVQLLLSAQTELEEALQFVDRAFIAPRLRGAHQQALEAADWLCVEGFRRFVPAQTGGESETTIGPLVAVDSRRSPAVWSPGESLPLPSLFQKAPQSVKRADGPDAGDRALASFPLVCLPANLVRSPGDYVLLSHEVGHAIDAVKDITKAILARLSEGGAINKGEYWEAWMREIVADAFGVLLSGEAYALSFAGYVRWMRVTDRLTTASRYPGITLRLRIICRLIEALGGSLDAGLGAEIMEGRDEADQPKLYPFLKEEFDQRVVDVVLEVIGGGESGAVQWKADKALIDAEVASLAGQLDDGSPERSAGFDFPLVPSVMTLLRRDRDSFTAQEEFELFRALHAALPAGERPEWVTDSSNWKFSEETLPTLRPTFISPDGIKVPPDVLLASHDHIAFVAATSGQLAKRLEAAFDAREGRPWKQLEFFAGTDTLLGSVVRDGDIDLPAERDTSEQALLDFLGREPGACESWAFYRFEDSLTFASFWDWNEAGGRIHVSSQIMGIDLRRCPSADHIWYDELPSVAYDAYRSYLKILRERAKRTVHSPSRGPAYL